MDYGLQYKRNIGFRISRNDSNIKKYIYLTNFLIGNLMNLLKRVLTSRTCLKGKNYQNLNQKDRQISWCQFCYRIYMSNGYLWYSEIKFRIYLVECAHSAGLAVNSPFNERANSCVFSALVTVRLPSSRMSAGLYERVFVSA